MNEYKEILAIDLAKNYRDENMSVEKYLFGVQKLIESNIYITKINNTLFMHKDLGDDVIEFHVANADSARMLIKNCKQFLQSISLQNFSKAITFFDNLKLDVIFVGMGFPYVTQQVNLGKYATYKTEVSL